MEHPVRPGHAHFHWTDHSRSDQEPKPKVGSSSGLTCVTCGFALALMNLDLVIAALEDQSHESVSDLLDDDQTVFWVDWRHEDDAIPNDCESILRTGDLSGELLQTAAHPGFEIYVCYKGKRTKVPLTVSGADRHITICTLNEALKPDYEVRFCIASYGSDTLAFLPLATSTWAELEQSYGERVGELFYKIAAQPNLFTDELDF